MPEFLLSKVRHALGWGCAILLSKRRIIRPGISSPACGDHRCYEIIVRSLELISFSVVGWVMRERESIRRLWLRLAGMQSWHGRLSPTARQWEGGAGKCYQGIQPALGSMASSWWGSGMIDWHRSHTDRSAVTQYRGNQPPRTNIHLTLALLTVDQ